MCVHTGISIIGRIQTKIWNEEKCLFKIAKMEAKQAQNSS